MEEEIESALTQAVMVVSDFKIHGISNQSV